MKNSNKPILEHITDFLDWIDIEKGLSTKTQENYARFIKRFTDWLSAQKLESLRPHELTAQHVWDYRVFLSREAHGRGGELKKTTQNYYLIALRSLLNFFADRDIASLPSEKVKLARDKRERHVRFLTLEQLKMLFSAPKTTSTQGLRDRAILETFFSTGLRIAELVALNKEQIKISDDTKLLELGIVGKGGRARTVYFSERALFWLKEYIKTRDDNDPALFLNYRKPRGASRRLTPRSIETMIKKYALAAGLPLNTTPHVMRHSFATDLLEQGIDIRNIQEFLGHKNITATQIYAHVTSKKLREIHEKAHGRL